MITHGNLASNAQVLHREWGIPRRATCWCTCCRSSTCTACSSPCHCVLMNGSRDALPREVRRRARARGFRANRPSSWACPRSTRACSPSPALTREACARMRLFVSGSAPLLAETHVEFERAHRPPHPRALRHDRDRHAHLEPARGRRAAPERSGRRCPAPRCASSTTRGTPCAPGANRPRAGEGRQRVPGLLAHAGEERARSSPPTATSAPATWAASRRTATSPSPGARRTSSSPAATTSIRRRSSCALDELPGVQESAVVGVPHPDFGEAVTAVVVAQRRARRRPKAELIARAQGAPRELQGAQARPRRRRPAAQRHGQGAEERAARTLRQGRRRVVSPPSRARARRAVPACRPALPGLARM